MGSLKPRRRGKRKIGKTAIVYLILSIIFLALFSILKSSCGSLREELINKLEMERNLSAENEELRAEIATITRERFLVLVAHERLGLKKAREEEVYVVR